MTVKQYRKNPKRVEAFVYTDDSSIVPILLSMKYKLSLRFNHDGVYIEKNSKNEVFARKGDYILKDDNGMFDVCKPEAFKNIYNEV